MAQDKRWLTFNYIQCYPNKGTKELSPVEEEEQSKFTLSDILKETQNFKTKVNPY